MADCLNDTSPLHVPRDNRGRCEGEYEFPPMGGLNDDLDMGPRPFEAWRLVDEYGCTVTHAVCLPFNSPQEACEGNVTDTRQASVMFEKSRAGPPSVPVLRDGLPGVSLPLRPRQVTVSYAVNTACSPYAKGCADPYFSDSGNNAASVPLSEPNLFSAARARAFKRVLSAPHGQVRTRQRELQDATTAALRAGA